MKNEWFLRSESRTCLGPRSETPHARRVLDPKHGLEQGLPVWTPGVSTPLKVNTSEILLANSAVLSRVLRVQLPVMLVFSMSVHCLRVIMGHGLQVG